MVYLISSLMCIVAIGGLSSQQTAPFLQEISGTRPNTLFKAWGLGSLLCVASSVRCILYETGHVKPCWNFCVFAVKPTKFEGCLLEGEGVLREQYFERQGGPLG